MHLLWWSIVLVSIPARIHAATTLFNGLQEFIFPAGTAQACLAAFNTTLSCDPKAQLLYKQTDWAGWNATDLTA